MHYKNVISQDALTISPNLAQSSALVQTKRYKLKGIKLLQKI